MPHEIDRQVKTWGTYGKNGDEPLRNILIKDISDSHLVNIIIHLYVHRSEFFENVNNTFNLMIREKEWRQTHGISVPEYLKDFKFFR